MVSNALVMSGRREDAARAMLSNPCGESAVCFAFASESQVTNARAFRPLRRSAATVPLETVRIRVFRFARFEDSGTGSLAELPRNTAQNCESSGTVRSSVINEAGIPYER